MLLLISRLDGEEEKLEERKKVNERTRRNRIRGYFHLHLSLAFAQLNSSDEEIND